ncbi:hypothetical protein FRB94_010405 [Tulasnella sp. JGI-2019a]|nr:hypothetical protein FRB93_013831 [Tulasnella sp. JGI-2019a]KAG9010442.1 hypothetical protein FRB94_010405 [Tulasnella sp. JGI-2019a]KAG9039924.1 hypothetical protein FRB95_004396 [Tulasnella sp. JGI-2019a]
MVRLSNFLSTPLLSIALVLLCRPVYSIPQPQFITSSDAEYSTDVNGNIVATIAGSLSVAVDANGLPLSTAFVTSTAVAAPVVNPNAAATNTVPIPVTNPLGPAPVTTYVYTSIDVNGNPNVITATFTPTYQPTVYPTSYRPATILAYSDFTSLYKIASATAGSVAASGARRAAFEGIAPLLWSGAATIAAFIAGARLVAVL